MNELTIALIVAGGEGMRAGQNVPKQYARLDGVSVLEKSLMPFLDHPAIDHVCVVIGQEHEEYYNDATGEHEKLLSPVTGGLRRQDSVRLGLEALASYHPARVLVHDAARPFVSETLITRLLEKLEHHPAAIPVIPVKDTIKVVQQGVITQTPDRTFLYAAQTPQGFFYTELLSAHRQHQYENVTDDAEICEKHGIMVQIVAGDEANIKLTTEEDFTRYES